MKEPLENVKIFIHKETTMKKFRRMFVIVMESVLNQMPISFSTAITTMSEATPGSTLQRKKVD